MGNCFSEDSNTFPCTNRCGRYTDASRSGLCQVCFNIRQQGPVMFHNPNQEAHNHFHQPNAPAPLPATLQYQPPVHMIPSAPLHQQLQQQQQLPHQPLLKHQQHSQQPGLLPPPPAFDETPGAPGTLAPSAPIMTKEVQYVDQPPLPTYTYPPPAPQQSHPSFQLAAHAPAGPSQAVAQGHVLPASPQVQCPSCHLQMLMPPGYYGQVKCPRCQVAFSPTGSTPSNPYINGTYTVGYSGAGSSRDNSSVGAGLAAGFVGGLVLASIFD